MRRPHQSIKTEVERKVERQRDRGCGFEMEVEREERSRDTERGEGEVRERERLREGGSREIGWVERERVKREKMTRREAEWERFER
jgi:hypothetical protein